PPQPLFPLILRHQGQISNRDCAACERTPSMIPSPPERVRLYVPWLTILNVLAAAALVWIWLQVWPIVMVVLVSLVLAIALEPVVQRLERWRFKRGLAVLVVGAVTL